MARKRRNDDPSCICGGIGAMERITDHAMVKCTYCDGTGIRRAVSPSAPEGLRDRLARTMWDAYWSSSPKTIGFPWEQSEEQHVWVAMADAVLAVLPPAPRVDVDAVMDLVDLFGHARANAATASNPESKVRLYERATERFDAIRAMLDGTA